MLECMLLSVTWAFRVQGFQSELWHTALTWCYLVKQCHWDSGPSWMTWEENWMTWEENFCIEKLWHAASFYTKQAFAQRNFYTQQAFTQQAFAHLTQRSSLQVFLKLPQSPHVLLTFDKVQNPLRMPSKTTSARDKVLPTDEFLTLLTFDISTSTSTAKVKCCSLTNALRATTACNVSFF